MKKKLLGLIACMALLAVSQASATTVTFVGGTLDATNTYYTESGMVVASSVVGVTGAALSHAPPAGLHLVGGDYFEIALTDHNSFKLDQIVFAGNPSGGGHTVLFGYSGINTATFSLGGGGAAYDFASLIDWSNISRFDWCGGCISTFDNQNTMLSITFDEISTATPLPATLPLFATGLGALGLLGWRRKRKAAALTT